MRKILCIPQQKMEERVQLTDENTLQRPSDTDPSSTKILYYSNEDGGTYGDIYVLPLYYFYSENNNLQVDIMSESTATLNETIQFYGSASGGQYPYIWHWDFGDGTCSSLQNPTHKYGKSGTYIVILNVTGKNHMYGVAKKTVEVTNKTNVLFISPKHVSIYSQEYVSFNVIIKQVPCGLSGYNITISLSNPYVAEISSIDFPSWAVLTGHSHLLSDTIWITAVDLNDYVKANDTNIHLLNITLHPIGSGDTPINIFATQFDDDSGHSIDFSVKNGELEVLVIRPLPHLQSFPTDPDEDGIFEDLNGNGLIDFDDVVEFFHYMTWIKENWPTESVDFNGNGLIDFDDVVELFKEV